MTETTMEALAAQQALVLGVLGWLLATGLALVLAAHWRRGVRYSTRGWLALAALPALGLWAVLAQQVATQGPLTRWDAALTQAAAAPTARGERGRQEIDRAIGAHGQPPQRRHVRQPVQTQQPEQQAGRETHF